MQAIPLTTQEAANTEFTRKLILTYADIIQLTSGTGASVLPGFNSAITFPTGLYVFAATAVVKTAFGFTGANNGTLVFTLGDSGDAARFIASTDLKGTVTYQAGAITKYPYVYTAAGQILLTVTAATQVIGLVNVGELHIYLGATQMPVLDR